MEAQQQQRHEPDVGQLLLELPVDAAREEAEDEARREAELETALETIAVDDDAPKREIYCEEAVAWLKRQPVPWPERTSVITSMPDVSETRMRLPEWQAWFTATAGRIMESVHPSQVAIFYQVSDRNRPNRHSTRTCAS